jgi:hypothetical protein
MQQPNELKAKKLRKGNLGSIEQDEFMEPILTILSSSGGKTRRQNILNQIHQLYGNQFNQKDYELLASQKPPKERWIHNVDWAKRKLVENGNLCKPNDSQWGMWVLTEKGKKD